MHALQAIETKYHGPTNYRGSRISARAEAGRIFIPYPYEASGVDCHAVAARAFAEKFGWTGRWYAGGTKDGYVFVRVPLDFDAPESYSFTVPELPIASTTGAASIRTPPEAATDDEISAARSLYCDGSDDNIEVDDGARASRTPDTFGVWVEAWLWVPRDEDSSTTNATTK